MSYQNIRDLNEENERRKSSVKKRKHRVRCHKCHEPCSGEVLKVQDRHFHVDCFYCKVCSRRLHSGGFYVRGEEYYCTSDYQNMFGTKCFVCHQYVEGEVVTALNNTYHKNCFKCDNCDQTFSPGSTVTYNGHRYVCQDCLANRSMLVGYNPMSPDIPAASPNYFEPSPPSNNHFITPYEEPRKLQQDNSKRVKCYKCHQYINHTTLVVAMDKLWHQWCFTCRVCKRMMAGKFVARGDDIYCEHHYFQSFGIRCISCHEFITGKVLMANKACYHYECATCAYCKQSFRNDQDLYKESDGARLWHQECGLVSRQQYISHSVDTGIDDALANNNSDFSSGYDTNSHHASREEVKTPTPQSEDVAISIASGMQSPPKVTHVRDFSQDSSDLNSQRSRHNSLYSQMTLPSPLNSPCVPDRVSDLQSTASGTQLSRTWDKKLFSKKNESTPPAALRDATNNHLRRRIMSDTFHSSYNSNANNKNFKKAHEFFAKKEVSSDTLKLPSTEFSPKNQHRQNSDVSSGSSSTDKRPSPVPLSPRKSPIIDPSATSTLKRTLKETNNYFEKTITEQGEDPSPVLEKTSVSYVSCDSTPTSSNSSLNSNPATPHLKYSTSDTSDPVQRKSNSNSSPLIKKAMRVKSAVFGTKSVPYDPVVYPLERLMVTAGEYQVFPKDVDRYRLEQHLSEEDFSLLFSMERDEFYTLPPWKQSDLKKRAKLF